MKKFFVCVLFSLAALSAKSQLTHLHDFTGSGFPIWSGDAYFIVDGNSVCIYNWDFTLNKTVNITPTNGFRIAQIQNISKDCFNNDNKWEMVLYFINNSNGTTKIMVFDEDGNIIEDFGSASSCTFVGFEKKNTELRCAVYFQNFNASSTTYTYTTKIYRCAGNGASLQSINQAQSKNKSVAYPNPARNIITLSYNLPSGNTSEIRIFNTAGQLVKTIPVGPHFNEVQVDVSSFPHGTYIYECEGVSNKFIVQ